ncbi:hypothetical protein HAY47_004580 [Salmonella enterica]|nr:hypothetical protein [Salmonella enterica]EEP0974877.1 hypothetical protein [Salmonella enterica]EEP1007138.1 hypothetical protein [Salmonella enterica]EEP1011797.1 hypothetical protein [Salmonella enterica]EEP1020951.1 hypothetical protein [Salmonella enterica]
MRLVVWHSSHEVHGWRWRGGFQVAGEDAGALARVLNLLQVARRVVLVVPPENIAFPLTPLAAVGG